MVVLVIATTLGWSGTIVMALGPPGVLQHLSNFGLVAITAAAALGCLRRARQEVGRAARCWRLLGASAASWGAGQVAWTWYESVLGHEVPFPSLADLGYLLAVPLAAGALLSLPLAAPTIAGRVRSVLDGLMVAGSLLLVSWVLVLGPVVRSGAESLVTLTISLAYPLGDVVVITIVLYTLLRARQVPQRLPVSLPLVGGALTAIAVADSGFVYLTTTGAYASGSFIDIGWFAGYALLLIAASRPAAATAEDSAEETVHRPLGTLLPYTAVTAAVLTSAMELVRYGTIEPFVSWTRTAIIILMVCRQVLTMMENAALTRTLEERVAARTAQLRASERRFAALVQHSSDVVTIVDECGVVSYQSSSSDRVFGYAPEALIGRNIGSFLEPGQAEAIAEGLDRAASHPYRTHTVVSRWRHADGRARYVEITITNLLTNPDVAGLVLNTRDVTDRKALEDQLVHQAFHDSLTLLPNRALFRNRIEQALTRSSGKSTAVLFLDLDGFKQVNDSLGHSSGDLLLIEVAERLRMAVRPGDTVARFGGDEFAVLVEGVTGEEVADELARRIADSMRAPFAINGREVHLQASIGIAALPAAGGNVEELLRDADLAMYRAKSLGEGGFARYNPEMHAHVLDRMSVETDLRRALDAEEFELHYQPLIVLRTGEVAGVEALIRWRRGDRLMPPAEFISIAEATGLIRPIGLWVIEEACRQAVEWQQTLPGMEHLKITVNVSGRQLQGDLVGGVADVLERTKIDPSRLVLEMTESTLLDNGDSTRALLRQLKELGVQLAIDDFGTGYSSLSYLHRFPIDVLKIDRSFVERLHAGECELVSTIVRLGQSMRLQTVAEGIEEYGQFLLLRQMGCHLGQGFHFSQPLPPDEMAQFLADSMPSAVALPAAWGSGTSSAPPGGVAGKGHPADPLDPAGVPQHVRGTAVLLS